MEAGLFVLRLPGTETVESTKVLALRLKKNSEPQRAQRLAKKNQTLTEVLQLENNTKPRRVLRRSKISSSSSSARLAARNNIL